MFIEDFLCEESKGSLDAAFSRRQFRPNPLFFVFYSEVEFVELQSKWRSMNNPSAINPGRRGCVMA